jgi:hypothetical protein
LNPGFAVFGYSFEGTCHFRGEENMTPIIESLVEHGLSLAGEERIAGDVTAFGLGFSQKHPESMPGASRVERKIDPGVRIQIIHLFHKIITTLEVGIHKDGRHLER